MTFFASFALVLIVRGNVFLGLADAIKKKIVFCANVFVVSKSDIFWERFGICCCGKSAI